MSNIYRAGVEAFKNKELDWDTDTIKTMAVKTGYSVDVDAHEDLADVSASRYVGTTDVLLASRTIETAAGNIVRLKAGTTTFPSVVLDGVNDIIGFIIYNDTGSPATSKLIAYVTLTVDVTPDGNNVDFIPNATDGIAKYTGT